MKFSKAVPFIVILLGMAKVVWSKDESSLEAAFDQRSHEKDKSNQGENMIQDSKNLRAAVDKDETPTAILSTLASSLRSLKTQYQNYVGFVKEAEEMVEGKVLDPKVDSHEIEELLEVRNMI